MSTAATSRNAVMIDLARVGLGYADSLVADVKPEAFARKPEGVDTNTPAFIFGHLALYPDKILERLGRSDLAEPDGGYIELFEAGQPCLDDPDGSKYPPMDEILGKFRDRHRVLLDALAEIDPAEFDKPNPNEQSRDRFPTVGHIVTFLLTSHIMMHLGQLSAWRRCMGLGAVM